MNNQVLQIQLCKHGHEMTPDTIYVRPSGLIDCRVCKKTSNEKYRKTINGILRQRVSRRKNSHLLKSEQGIIVKRNQNYVSHAVANGKLIKNHKCIDCGETGVTEIHHEKYHMPPVLYDIAEVCKDCHGVRHEKGEGEIV